MKTLVIWNILLLFNTVFSNQENSPWHGSIRALKYEKEAKRSSANSGRIYGGTEAVRHQFPYQVGVIVDEAKICGGSLISLRYVLTAAHCTFNYSSFEVHLAAHNIMDEGEQDRLIISAFLVEAITYDFWNPDLILNDIALLKLPYNVSGTGIATVRLPSWSQENFTFADMMGLVSGWGKLHGSDPYTSPILNYVNLTIIGIEECKAAVSIFDEHAHICTDSNNGTQAPCNGDSGGPMVITENDGLPTLVGLVSFGPSECNKILPSVFTRVTNYLEWIQNQTDIIINP